MCGAVLRMYNMFKVGAIPCKAIYPAKAVLSLCYSDILHILLFVVVVVAFISPDLDTRVYLGRPASTAPFSLVDNVFFTTLLALFDIIYIQSRRGQLMIFKKSRSTFGGFSFLLVFYLWMLGTS